MQFIRQGLGNMRTRWTALAAAMLIQGCGGLTYTYAVYSGYLKEALDYTQEQTDDVGAAKDFGYCIGIIGGILYNYYAPWVTIAIGASFHFLGYFLVWLSITERFRAPFWLLCTSIAIGVGGDSWMDAACMMTSLQNFQENRGTVVGLLKAQVGISGAIFVTIYKAFLKPDVDKYVLMVAVVPSVASFLLASHIRAAAAEPASENVKLRFQSAYGGIILLAIFLLLSIVIQAFLDVHKSVLTFFAIFMLIILCGTYFLVVSNNALPFLALTLGTRKLQTKVSDVQYSPPGVPPNEDIEDEMATLQSSQGILAHEPINFVPPNHSSSVKLLPINNFGPERTSASSRTEEDTVPLKGPEDAYDSVIVNNSTHARQNDGADNGQTDFTLWESMQQLNYWLLAFVMMTGPGSGLAVINNLAQMGEALLSKKVELFVGLISIWSCFGRLAAGYGSDAMVRSGYPRPICLFLAQATLAIGCLLLSLGHVTLLYVGSAAIGLCYGSFWALSPAILSEVFGLSHFAAIYKTIVSFSPIGAFVLSAKLVGYLYDEQVERYHEQALDSDFDDEHTCYGQRCFEFSLRFLALVCITGAGASMILTLRTQRLYSNKPNLAVTTKRQAPMRK